MKYWEIVADKLSAVGWSCGYRSAVTRDGWRWFVVAHSGDGRRYIVQSDELLTAFLELEANAAVIACLGCILLFGATGRTGASSQFTVQHCTY